MNFKSFGCAILISNPELKDSVLEKSVIFIGEHTFGGANGVVLNRPENKVISHISEDFIHSPLGDIPVYCGGNKYRHQLTITSWNTNDDIVEISYMLGMEEVLEMMSQENIPQFRAYLGYLTWKKNELNRQIKNGKLTQIAVEDLIHSKKHGKHLWLELADKYYTKEQMLCAKMIF